MSTSIQSRSILLFFLRLSIFFLRSSSASYSSSSSSQISYSPYCSHIVPESTRSVPYSPPPTFLQLSNAYAGKAEQLLGPSASQVNVHFKPNTVFRTQNPQILQIDGTLQLRVSRAWGFSQNATVRRLYRVYGGPRLFRFRGAVDFQLSGFWSSSGRLCMVGSGQMKSPIAGKDLRFSVAFKLNYPNNSVIATSLASGTLESLDSEGVAGFFRPISVVGFSQMNYEFSLVKDETGKNYAVKSPSSLHTSSRDCIRLISLSDRFEIEYGGSCQGNSCTLPSHLFGYLPKFMSVNVIDCSTDPFVRFSLEFSNSSRIHNGFLKPFNPANTLIAEGIWNENRNQVRAVACRISMNSSGNASVGECWIRLNFTLSSVLSIRWRSLVDGQIWSNKSVDDVNYFDKIQIRTSVPKMWGLTGLRYEYTEIERAKTYCSKTITPTKKRTTYPDPYSSDMKFDMEIKNDKNQVSLGALIPLFVAGHSGLNNYSNTYLVNVSYSVVLNSMYKFDLGSNRVLKKVNYISAEGTYNTGTGQLCMVGCWSHEEQFMDCEIFIKIQFPHGSTRMPKGSIQSKRPITDPLFFEPLTIKAISITERQAKKSVWRMDFEMIMVLISNTLACVFIGLQLLHVKNYPQVLPFISLVMLVVLVFSHMVPLLLNFDAILSNRKRQNVLLATGDWLEINEILVRATTMIVFLLEARLLQLTWQSRNANTTPKLRESEKKVVHLYLPLCFFGALMAYWGDIKAYAGLILDAFLFPQIIFNFFCGSKQSALSLPYYAGNTVVRMLPHVYDLVRTRTKLHLWYIYANPRLNFYSTSWDIVISFCCFFFAVIVYLQQRFGSGCLLPSRLRERYEYHEVSVAIPDDK